VDGSYEFAVDRDSSEAESAQQWPERLVKSTTSLA